MILGNLSAGIASSSLDPELGVDLVGYLRRAQPAQGYGQPLEVGVLVLDDGISRAVIVSLDTLGVPAIWSTAIRAAAATAARCEPVNVLVNASHTHAAPPPPRLRKLGGRLEFQDSEQRYADSVVEAVADLTGAAVSKLTPVVAMVSKGETQGMVNRRQRLGDGRMALGYSQNSPTNHDVSVIAFDSPEGNPVATVVSVACHPIVIGPDVAESSSDFVGALRAVVREWTGADCMFLQGCAGNMMPLYAMFDHVGPERVFGTNIALDALRIRRDAQRDRTVPQMREIYSSAVPFALWRPVSSSKPQPVTIRTKETTVELSISPLPSASEMAKTKVDLAAHLADLQNQHKPEEALNPIRIHLDWATDAESQLMAGHPGYVRSSVQLLSIGGLHIYGMPGEAFCEIGMEIARQTSADFGLILGYTNDAIGYIATDQEMLRGGYEPTLSHRHYGQPSPFSKGSADVLVRAALSMD